MTSLAPTLQSFFTDRLMTQRHASPNTIAAYRDTFRLLLGFAQTTTGKQPTDLDVADLDITLITGFLTYIETERHNNPRTRNARLAAIRSLFRYAAMKHPEHAATIQRVLAIPQKRFDKRLVSFLEPAEVDALIAAPDRTTWIGRRDHALLIVAIQTGLRVSELASLNRADIVLGVGPNVSCNGKGRKQRCTPLTPQTVAVLRVWMKELDDQPDHALFPTRTGGHLSRDAIEDRVTKHAATARQHCPTLKTKTVSPHTLRHTCAMRLLHAEVDISVIAMWLGHEDIEATQMYFHADMTIKQRAITRTTPPNTTPGRYRPPDKLLAFLESL